MEGTFAATDDKVIREQWANNLLKNCDIVSDGHRILTLGAHTGHTWKTVALCENAEIAAAIVTAICKARHL